MEISTFTSKRNTQTLAFIPSFLVAKNTNLTFWLTQCILCSR